jgi:hypothetical protein
MACRGLASVCRSTSHAGIDEPQTLHRSVILLHLHEWLDHIDDDLVGGNAFCDGVPRVGIADVF